MRPFLALLIVTPLLVGCLGGDDAPETDASTIAASAEEAGATAGPAPSAPKNPYLVTTGDDASSGSPRTAYPVAIETNPAREPVRLDLSGEFAPQDCGLGGLPMDGFGLTRAWQWNDLSENLAVGDVFSYEIEMRFTNTEQNWAEIHLFYGMGGTSDFWSDPTGDVRGEVVMNFTGQSYRVDDDDQAWVGAACWYGFPTEPIPYTLTVTLTFAEAAVPSGAPVLLKVPANATTLFARGVALNPDEGVNSHYRIFGPDDELLCECGLNTNEEAASFTLPGPGDYVILVDHTSNGFVSFALDAPPESNLVPLPNEGVIYPILSAEGESVDENVVIDLPSTPLAMGTWVFPPGFQAGDSPDAGIGKGYTISIANGRGDVLRSSLAGWFTYRAMVPGVFWSNEWYPVPFPGGEWSFFEDHHAYAKGAHTVHVKADQMRGDAIVFAIHYVRPA